MTGLSCVYFQKEVFSAGDVKEMFCYKAAGKELDTFSPTIRQPLPSSFVLSIKYFVLLGDDETIDTEWKMLSSVDVLIWADVAPKACQLLRRYVENKYYFTIAHVVGHAADEAVLTLERVKWKD